MLLAACSGGTTTGDGSPETPPQQAPAPGPTSSTCTAAPTEFTNVVWPSIQSKCVACHTPGGLSGGTPLSFSNDPNAMVQNYNVLRSHVLTNGTLILMKSVGTISHGGGAPFVDANSQQYKDLAALIPIMQQPCAGSPTPPVPAPPTPAGAFWNDVSLIDDATVLAKAAILFQSRAPTAAESAAASTAGLRATIRGYMTGAPFDRLLEEIGDTHFLTPGITVFGNNMGLSATDFPSATDLINNTNGFDGTVRNRFQASIRREQIELMKYIVKSESPWTDIVAGNYTVLNGVINQFMGASVTGTFVNVADDNEWLPGTWKSERLGGAREHAGVLTTQGWLQRNPTTPTNRNRHRIYIVGKQFLATDFTALATRPLNNGTGFLVPWMENPACKICHDIIDPMAAGFRNWNEANRYLPNRDSTGVDHALPGVYRANNYPRDGNGQRYYQLGDTWFRDVMPPGYNGVAMPGGVGQSRMALQWLGTQIAGDARFALGSVYFWYKGIFGREPMAAPQDTTSPQYTGMLAAYNAQNEELQQIASRFAAGGYKVKDLLADLVLSRTYRAINATGATTNRAIELRAVGSGKLLSPAHLQRKLQSLLGVTYAGFNNPVAGEGLNYGNFDGVARVDRAADYTMLQTTTIDRVAASLSCTIVRNDFQRAAGQRMLFTTAQLTDSPATTAGADAIRQNIALLHQVLLKENLGLTNPEINRTYQLFMDVWNDRATAPARPTACVFNNTNDPNYVGRAWAAVIAYMIGDPKFLFE